MAQCGFLGSVHARGACVGKCMQIIIRLAGLKSTLRQPHARALPSTVHVLGILSRLTHSLRECMTPSTSWCCHNAVRLLVARLHAAPSRSPPLEPLSIPPAACTCLALSCAVCYNNCTLSSFEVARRAAEKTVSESLNLGNLVLI